LLKVSTVLSLLQRLSTRGDCVCFENGFVLKPAGACLLKGQYVHTFVCGGSLGFFCKQAKVLLTCCVLSFSRCLFRTGFVFQGASSFYPEVDRFLSSKQFFRVRPDDEFTFTGMFVFTSSLSLSLSLSLASFVLVSLNVLKVSLQVAVRGRCGGRALQKRRL
jgi:hypothetical protein